MSAIGWLSESVTAPKVRPTPPPDAGGAELPAAVSVGTINQAVPDTAGWIKPDGIGVPADLWGRSSATDLAKLMRAMSIPSDAPPTLRAFVRDLVVAGLNPPVDAMVDDSLFLARTDTLLSMGALSAADRLLREAGLQDPERFRRAFDIALLTEQETEACVSMAETPEISPTVTARIFCLARNGEWDVAALTLGTARALSLLDDDEELLLLHFL